MGKRVNTAAKGKAFEQAVARKIREAGIECGRVPKSGALRGFDESLKDDLKAVLKDGTELRIECKKHAERPSEYIYEWLDGSDALVMQRDRKEPLVVLTLKDWIAMIGGGE